ncbi:MAG: hypothetical protein KBD65_00180 [Candidatus Moranbacteria bacterium]|nr:hypothetical protein [Candidatus Moranbacteria bacterium]
MTSLVQKKSFFVDYLVGISLGIVAVFALDLGGIDYATAWWPWSFAKEGVAVSIGLVAAIFLGIADDDGLWVFPPFGATAAILLGADLLLKFLW